MDRMSSDMFDVGDLVLVEAHIKKWYQQKAAGRRDEKASFDLVSLNLLKSATAAERQAIKDANSPKKVAADTKY